MVNQKAEISGMDKEQDSTILFLQETYFRFKYKNKLNIKEWKKIPMHTVTKRASVPIVISHKTYFKTKKKML